MIRTGNKSAAIALIQQLLPLLNRILILQYMSSSVILGLIVLNSTFSSAFPIEIFTLLWMISESLLALAYRHQLNAFKVESELYCLGDKRRLRKGRQLIVVFGYVKFLCLLLDILGMMQNKSLISLHTMGFFLLSSIQIPLTLLALLRVKDLSALLEKINRIINSFDIYFQEENEDLAKNNAIGSANGLNNI